MYIKRHLFGGIFYPTEGIYELYDWRYPFLFWNEDKQEYRMPLLVPPDAFFADSRVITATTDRLGVSFIYCPESDVLRDPCGNDPGRLTGRPEPVHNPPPAAW